MNEDLFYTPQEQIVDNGWIEYPQEVKDLILQNVDSLSTVDSRHIASTYPLREYFSEMGLHKNRIKVELVHFIAMSESDEFEEVPKLSEEQKFKLYKLIEEFDKEEAIKVIEYDHFWRKWKLATEHDVKSVEYYIAEKLEEIWLWDYKSFVHIYCTSEDINNIAYHSMLRDAMNNVMLPKLRWIISNFSWLVEKYKSEPMMWRTHGQPASPTTFWKEIAVFNDRLINNLKRLEGLILNVKFNWPVWNYNSHTLAKPDVNWTEYSENLANSFWFDIAYLTNQRWPMTENVALFQIIQNLNTTLQDFCTDIWLYNSDWRVFHRKVKGEVWSSVMPQKVNPWFLEEAEWFLSMANDAFNTFIRNNDKSRMQRDMTWHPQERNYWDAMWQTLTAWTNILESLSRIDFDKEHNEKELMEHPEVVTEWIQTILRRERQDSAYEILMAIAKWDNMSLQSLKDFTTYLWQKIWEKNEDYLFLNDLDDNLRSIVKNIVLDKDVVDDLSTITPVSFIWTAPQLAEKWNERVISFMEKFDKKVALTTRDRVQAVLFDFDNTLQLWDKEELKTKLSSINNDLELNISEEDMDLVCKLSCFREMITEMVKLSKKDITEEDIQKSNDKVTWNFDYKFYLDEGSKELLDLLNKNNIPVWIISTRWNQSLLRLVNNVHQIWDQVDVVLGRDDVRDRKPNPEGINKALERLGINNEDVSYIGDKWEDDVVWAKNADVTPIYIERTDEGISIQEKWEVLTFSNIKELYNYFYSKLI
jgi:adenylosuccinate lyase